MIQRMFVTIDTKKTNYKNVGKIIHGDDLILELTVLSDGDMISFNDPMVDLLVKKSDGKMIRQNSGIEHIKPNKFVIEVGKDCVTSPGLSTNQLIINDNGRISTCMFYYTILNSLEEDIIQSISSVEVLEQLDEYAIEARERIELLNDDINELEELFGATSDKLVEAEMDRNEAEQNRIQSEILRVNNENDRIEADNIRNQNEIDRSTSELVREQRESERILNEEESRQNESERMIDESTRQQNENARQSNESIRIINETDRKIQENRRVTAETNRANAETTRRNNENSRISNETERQKAMNEMKSLLEDARGFDDRVDVIEDEIEEINSSLDNLESEVNELKEGNINIDLTNYATKTELSLKVDKVNGKSLISDSEIERLSTLKNYDDTEIKNTLNSKANKTELHSHSNKTVLDGISSAKITEWNNKSTFSGNYNDLTNKPTIPTLNGYATEQYVNEEIKKIDVTEQLADYAKKSELHSHSNKSVLDLITTSKITEWNNKSTFNGNYNNLTNKPTIPTKTSQLTNDSGFITTVPSEYVTESELNNKGYLTSVPSEYVTETELNTALEEFNPNSLQQVPLYANSIEECTDTTKCYVLPDGFIYAYKETTVEIEPPDPEDPNEPLYTNVFEVDGYNLNKRWSHSGKKYSDANGHVASGYIPVKVGDVVRIKCKNLTLGSLNYDYNRIHFFDSNNNYVSGHYDSGFNDLLKVTDEGDNTFSFTVGYVCKTSGDDSTNYLMAGANNITKMLIVFNIGLVAFNNETKLLTDEDYINANIIVTVNQEIKEPVVVQPSKNLVDTATYYLNARYNSSNTLKQTDAETGYVAFDYIDIKKGDILRFKSTTRGYHGYGGSLLLCGNYPRLRFFNANNQLVASGGSDSTPIKDFFKLVDEGDNTTAIYVGYKADGTLYDDADQIAKTRFTIQVTGDDLPAVTEADMQNVKITINTPMSELDNVLPPEGNTQVVWKWSNTGHAFVPNENYDNLIADMKNITDEHSKDIVYLKAVVNSEDSTSGLSDSQKIARIKNWDMPIYENAPVFLLEQNKAGISQAELTNEKVYERYDTLMNSHSHYITRENCGMASDGTTPIYIYHFREPEPHIEGRKGSEKKPVILICSGVHPTERAGEYSMYYAMEEITTNPELADLKRNVHFIIMPIINPTGVTDSTWGVRNPDGIQVHYNFEVDFKYPTDSGYVTLGNRNHGGETPLSIPETQYFDKIMRDYQKDLAIVMSCHNNDVDTIRGTDFIWCSCATNFTTNIGYRLADKMSLAWRQKHGSAFDEGVIWANQYALQKASEGSSLFNPTYVKERPKWDWRVGQAGLSGSGGTEYKQALKYGVQGINVEVCARNMVMDKSFNMTWSSNVMTWGCETYVNFFRIFMAVYDYKDKEQYYKK